MRLHNDCVCPISDNEDEVVEMAQGAFLSAISDFERAASNKTVFRVKLQCGDLKMLKTIFEGSEFSVYEMIRSYVQYVLMQLDMPYMVAGILRVGNSTRFYLRLEEI